MIYTVLLITEVLLSISLITLVLMQHGKGADAGAAFGSGASGTVFGSQGSANFLSRTTAILATLFFINCLALAYIVANRPQASSALDSVVEQLEKSSPAKAPVVEQPTPEAAEPAADSSAQDIPEQAPAPAAEGAPVKPQDIPE